MSEAAGHYRVDVLSNNHDRTGFQCGVDALDRYFRQQAGQEHRRAVAVPYVLVDTTSGQVVGYYTLSSFAIDRSDLPEHLARGLPRYERLPAILIGRLAVDSRHQRRGLGGTMLLDALRRALVVSEQVGAIGVIVDAKDDAACAFDEAFQFIPFADEPRRLFLPMATIRQLA